MAAIDRENAGSPFASPCYIARELGARRRRCPDDVRDLPASNDSLSRFLGGTPLAVALRLILLSILVGVVLAAIGFDPWNILAQHPPPVPAAVGSRLRRGQLAVALLPARRRDRDPDLADCRGCSATRADDSRIGAADATSICRLWRCARLRRPLQHLLSCHRRARQFPDRLRRLVAAGAEASTASRATAIDVILITHFHGDHFAGLPFLLLDAQFTRRTRPLVIAGPAGIETRLTPG